MREPNTLRSEPIKLLLFISFEMENGARPVPTRSLLPAHVLNTHTRRVIYTGLVCMRVRVRPVYWPAAFRRTRLTVSCKYFYD